LGDHREMTAVRLMKIRSQSAFLTVVALCAPAYAQSLSAPGKAFVEKAAKGNLAEVELGKLALQKSNDAQVKAFGQQMITDHSKANDSLKPIADSAHIAWQAALNSKQREQSSIWRDRLTKFWVSSGA
jgi:putative membrane protein